MILLKLSLTPLMKQMEYYIRGDVFMEKMILFDPPLIIIHPCESSLSINKLQWIVCSPNFVRAFLAKGYGTYVESYREKL